MEKLQEFLRSENRLTWALLGLVGLLLAAELFLVFLALCTNLPYGDNVYHTQEICAGIALWLTALPVWLGILRVRGWRRQSLLHFRRLHGVSDIMALLFAPELPEQLVQQLEYTRPPKILYNRRAGLPQDDSLLGRLRHFIRHFAAYEAAYVGHCMVTNCFARTTALNLVYERRRKLLLRPLPRRRNLIPLAIVLSLAVLIQGLRLDMLWLLYLMPLIYIALVWNTCRIEAQRIGLRNMLLEVFDPAQECGGLVKVATASEEDLTDLVRVVKRRAAPATRSLRI